jgi:hypothetical protein
VNTRFIAAIVLAAGLAVAAAADQPSTPDHAALAALEQEWLNAEHDPAVLDRILADDFLHPVPAGVFLTKTQHIRWAASHPGPSGRRLRFEDLRIRTYGDTGVVTGVVVSTDAHAHEDRSVFTDVFVRRSGRWQAINAQENAVEPAAHR